MPAIMFCMGLMDLFINFIVNILLKFICNSHASLGDGTVFVGSTEFPNNYETEKCIDQLEKSTKKAGAWVRECLQRNEIEEEGKITCLDVGKKSEWPPKCFSPLLLCAFF